MLKKCVNEPFTKYYYEFLGVNKGEINKDILICESIYRDKPLNKQYFYPIIVSEFNGKKICSSSSKFIDICMNNYDGTVESLTKILKGINNTENSYKIRKMMRYTIGEEDSLNTIAIPLTEEIARKIQFEGNCNIEEFIERKREIIKEGRQFIVIEENKMAAMAFITEVYERGCNIAVYTNPQYRNKGYGKEVVKGCINWCKKRELVPIYLVEEENISSIKLAESVGFKMKSLECIISK